TEATIIATAIDLGAADTRRRPPIGRPIGGVRAYVLDSAGRLVPRGAVGELCLAGAGLADGYLGRPDLTSDRFGPDPYGEGRLYRTGDRVRWLRDEPVLEFLGRIDRQLKVRGVRIEPGEVEAVLTGHPGVGQAVVTAAGATLVGYVTGQVSPEEVREYAGERLPALLVPNVIVVLDALPLNRHGKVDLAALPPVAAAEQTRPEYVAPRSDAEALIAGIFTELLAVEQVGAHDDFFELGGHSLLAIRVIARIRAAIDLDLPVRALFEQPTVAGFADTVEQALIAEIDRLTEEEAAAKLAARLQQAAAAPAATAPAAIPPRPPGTTVPLSHAQERLWCMEQFAPGTAAYTIPVVLRIRGRLDPAVLQTALGDVIARHESLRMRFDADADGQPVLHIDENVPVTLAVVEAEGADLAAREEYVHRAIQVRLAEPVDLATGPLLRAALYRLHPDDQVLMLAVHHIICDGWSVEVLVDEVLTRYDAHTAGRPEPLPPLPVQYGDFACWQRGRVADGTHARDVAYWRERLTGVPPLDLPTDFPRPAEQTFNGDTHNIVLDAELSEALRRLAREHGATLYMTLMAAYAAVLARYAGQDDFAIGSPQAGRYHPELEPLIGMFVNMLVTRIDAAGDPTFAQLLARVRETTLDGYAHQELPFEELITELNVVRDVGRSALFQVAFALQNYTAPGKTAGKGLSVGPFGWRAVATRFDLELALFDDADGLWGAFTYNTDLFTAETVAGIADSFRQVLTTVVADPHQPLSRLLSATGPARARVLTEWNDTEAEFPDTATLPELIQRQAAATPDAPALTFEGETLTYSQLLARAYQVAHRLRAQGAGPGKLVAVCALRSPELVVGLLGVLFSGAAYVPLDPEYPAQRLAFMLTDADPVAVLTAGEAASVLPATDHPVLALDDPATWAESPTTAPELLAGPDDPAYAIYTSGSTGQP